MLSLLVRLLSSRWPLLQPLSVTGCDQQPGAAHWCSRGDNSPPPVLLPPVQAFDDWVPLDVVRDLVRHLFASSSKLLADICPPDELNWARL